MDEIKDVILNNSNLIYSIASKFRGHDMDDLFQVGCIGMIEAYKHFDKSKNVKFTTYAYSFILGKISEYVRENHNVRVSKDVQRMKKKILRVKEALAQELMREPTNFEVSEYLDISLNNLELIMGYGGDGVSLDEVYFDDLSLYDVTGDKTIDYNSLTFLKDEINKLKEPERSIMIKRYFEDMTQCDTAHDLGLSQVEVSRKEKKVLVKLRQM